MAEDKTTQQLLMKPSLPLVDKEPIDVDKTSTISFTLKVRPGGNNEHTYKKTMRLFAEGTPFEWLLTMRDLREVWKQNGLNGPADRASVVRAILRDDALAQFTTALESEQAGQDGNVPALTVEMVEVALTAVTSAIFPHRALETQKLWMRRHMKKPLSMTYRSLQAKVLQINSYLPAFPDASENDKFSERELLGILEFALPNRWRKKFDLDGYVPTDHNRARLLRECEALERNEPGETGRIPRKQPKKKAKREEKEAKASDAAKASGNKYCRQHGWGSHSTPNCWTLHPELKPDKFKEGTGPQKKGPNKAKESHAMLRNVMKEQLHELLTTMRDQKPKKKVVFKRKRVMNKKHAADPSSDSESDHEMETTPAPSDEEDTLKSVQRFLAEEGQDSP